MARMNEDGQWIVLMGFMVSVGIIFLAVVINQATIVGQTTSEAVLEFPKLEIQDLRSEVISIGSEWGDLNAGQQAKITADITNLSLYRNNAMVGFTVTPDKYEDTFYLYNEVDIRYSNGVTTYEEQYSIPKKK